MCTLLDCMWLLSLALREITECVCGRQVSAGAGYPWKQDRTWTHHRLLHCHHAWGGGGSNPRERPYCRPQQAVPQTQSVWKHLPQQVRRVYVFTVLCNGSTEGARCRWNRRDYVREGMQGRRDSRTFFSSQEFQVPVPNFREGRPFPYLWKNGERERYRPRQWWKLMYSDRICSVRKFKVEVRGLHGPSGQRQTSEVTDIVGLRGPVRETFKFFPPLCLLSGLPDFCVRFSTDVNQERSQMFYNKVLLAAGNMDTQPRRDRNWQYCSWGSDVKFLVPIFQQSPSAGCVRERSCVSPLASTSCSRNRWAR